MRCVHLDFHTSPLITDIGNRFDKKKFAERISEAKVELMTVFAKCHHGYTYYPSKVAQMHPGLDFNLLGEQIEALHSVGVKAPIYITAGWSKKDADEHPEWHQIDFFTGKASFVGADPERAAFSKEPLEHCSWINLCLVGGYRHHLEAITREVCESFDVSDGIFYDICFAGEGCVCRSCVEKMREKGLDPERYEDVKLHYSEERVELMKRLTSIVHEYSANAPVFYNGGADMNRTEYHPYQTHYELEDLPTAWGGYDLMPLRAKFFERYGKRFLGMTGKFHHAWGEFGGFKNKDALVYECADMLSIGASISIGDQLHPSGEPDESTYRIIGHAFDYVERIERYSENTRARADIAIWLSHSYESDMGASKLLQIMHQEYDVIESGDDISKYRCIIFPDKAALSCRDIAEVAEFVRRGGAVVMSYESGMPELGIEKIAPSEYDTDYIGCEIDEITTPFLSYSSAYRVKAEGEVLARIYEPYFSRTGEHFSGHKNTPNRTEPADYPALVKNGRVIYFAHSVFANYNNTGSYALERYIIKGIDEVYDRAIRTRELPSSGRVRLREERDGKFIALHLLYAPPINRGNVCLLPDFPRLYGVEVSVRVDRKISSCVTQPDGTEVEFSQTGDILTLKIPPFRCHSLIILK